MVCLILLNEILNFSEYFGLNRLNQSNILLIALLGLHSQI